MRTAGAVQAELLNAEIENLRAKSEASRASLSRLADK
jgi:hypothetical protein